MRVESVYQSTFSTRNKERVPQPKTKQQLDKEKADFKEIFEQAKKKLDSKK